MPGSKKRIAMLALTAALTASAHAASDMRWTPSLQTYMQERWRDMPEREQQWRRPDPDNIVYLQLDSGTVVIELLPELAPDHVRNVKALVRGGYFDSMAIARVQENYVVQWNAPSPVAIPPQAAFFLSPEFSYRGKPAGDFQTLPLRDGFAAEVGLLKSFPAARNPQHNETWLAHCYGAVGAGRDDDAGSGGGREWYVVTGHAPRHLDKNVTLFAHVLQGTGLLATLPRGKAAQGFYLPEQTAPVIRRMVIEADLPASQRTPLEVLDSRSRAYLQLWKNWQQLALPHQAAYTDLCQFPVIVRPAAR